MLHPKYSTVEGLKSRCEIDRATGCWNWIGGVNDDGHPIVRVFDERHGEKRAMHAARAMFIAAYGRKPNRIAYRCCLNKLCLNWNHLREARSQSELITTIASMGAYKGTWIEQRRAAAHKGLAAQGIRVTPPEVVAAIRAMPASTSHTAVGALLGVSRHVVAGVRSGKNHRETRDASTVHVEPADTEIVRGGQVQGLG